MIQNDYYIFNYYQLRCAFYYMDLKLHLKLVYKDNDIDLELRGDIDKYGKFNDNIFNFHDNDEFIIKSQGLVVFVCDWQVYFNLIDKTVANYYWEVRYYENDRYKFTINSMKIENIMKAQGLYDIQSLIDYGLNIFSNL